MPRPYFLLAILCMPLIAGCDGCRRDAGVNDDAESPEVAPLDSFTAESPDPFPSAGLLADGGVPTGRAVKLGHWTTASVGIKSNLDDSRGELITRAGSMGIDFRSGTSSRSMSGIPSVRPVVLPKGQLRRFDYRIFIPIPSGSQQKSVSLGGKYVARNRSVAADVPTMPFIAMHTEEYFFVILSNRPERFAKLRKADWVKPFRDPFDFPISGANYRIVTASTDGIVPLAETMLDWTSTSVLLWDDVGEDILTPDQQTALADWIRFGGRLIVNGPQASDSFDRSGLSDLLPMKPSGNIELNADDGERLLNGWQVKTDKSTEKQIALLRSRSGRVAINGTLAADAKSIDGTGGLLLERAVGRGSVIQSRFDLTSNWLIDWDSFDSFVNAAILGRPVRQFAIADRQGLVRQTYVFSGRANSDATMNTGLRIASRDARLGNIGMYGQSIASEKADDGVVKEVDQETGKEFVVRTEASTRVATVAGVAGWTDTSDVMETCKEILRSESGIEIPKSSLVVRSLGYYLLILVPINFLVFRLMGRLEYAWLAVPVIAIGGAIWVARSARLDIGFARSRTELALLEMQPEYGRGHLTRIDAIYNSLSSTYDVQFKTIDGCALPMRSVLAETDFGDPEFQTSFQEGPSLAALAVGSNQVRLIHAEQMVDVGGTIEVDSQGRLVNASTLEILDAFVIERKPDGDTRIAAVGASDPGSAVGLRFREQTDLLVSDELPMQSARLMRRLALAASMPADSMRLIGRVDHSIDGMTIVPTASQTFAQTIVLAHLRHPPKPDIRPDRNLRSDMNLRGRADAGNRKNGGED